MNADAICYGCHSYFHQNPNEHEAWQIAKKGQEVVDWLTTLAHSYKKKDRKAERALWRSKLLEDFGIKA